MAVAASRIRAACGISPGEDARPFCMSMTKRAEPADGVESIIANEGNGIIQTSLTSPSVGGGEDF